MKKFGLVKEFYFWMESQHKRGPEHTDIVLITRETRDPGGKPSPNAAIKHKVHKIFWRYFINTASCITKRVYY